MQQTPEQQEITQKTLEHYALVLEQYLDGLSLGEIFSSDFLKSEDE